MEKSRTSKISFYSYRLLAKFLLGCFFLILPYKISAVSYSKLQIVPEKDYCFAGEMTNYYLDVPGVLPERVDVTVQSAPDHVTLVSTSKDEYNFDGTRGTRITFVFKFSEKGSYKIPALAARIDWSWGHIPFKRITVYENPIMLDPLVSLEVPQQAVVGQEFPVTVSARFFSEILDVSANLDENVILRKVDVLQELPFKVKGFTEDYYPVIVYGITPFKTGKLKLPQIVVQFRSYAGIQQVVLSEPKIVQVVSAPAKVEEKEENPAFEFAFSDTIEGFVSAPEEKKVSLYEIALRLKKERKLHVYGLIAASVFLAAGLGMMLAGFLKNRIRLRISGYAASVVSLTALIIFIVMLVPVYRISGGSSVHTVPERNSNTVEILPAGTVVQVIDSTSEWYAITSGTKTTGWILKRESYSIDELCSMGPEEE